MSNPLPTIDHALAEARAEAAAQPPGVRIYCEPCNKYQPFTLERVQADELNPIPWADIICMVCHFVIGTVSAPEPGIYSIVRTGD